MDAPSPQQVSARSLRWWVLAGLLIVLLAVAVQYTFKASDDRSAFVRWRNQILDLGRGVDIYQVHVYPNPPIMALILYPYALLPELDLPQFDVDIGALAWFGTKVVMTIIAFLWTVQLVQSREQPFPPWAQAVVLLLALRPIIGDLSHGNVNLLIMFLVVASLFAYQNGRDFLAGVVMGLAIACKVTPALFVPYFLWKRAWATLAGCAVGLVLFLVLVPGLILGFAENQQLLVSWYEKMVAPYASGAEVTTEHSNQSLPGLLYRLTTTSPSFLDEQDLPAEYHNVVDLNPWVARRILQALGLGFLVLMAWSCRVPVSPRGGWQQAAEFSIVLLGMLLFSERTWKHHCVTLLVPLAVVCYYLATHWSHTVMRWYLIATLVVAELAMAATSTSLWEKVAGYRLGAKLAQVYGTYVWAYLLFLAALVVLLALERRRVRTEQSTPGKASAPPWSFGPHLRSAGRIPSST